MSDRNPFPSQYHFKGYTITQHEGVTIFDFGGGVPCYMDNTTGKINDVFSPLEKITKESAVKGVPSDLSTRYYHNLVEFLGLDRDTAYIATRMAISHFKR